MLFLYLVVYLVGNVSPLICAFAFQGKQNICTHVGGAISSSKHDIVWSQLQIRVLSSNTKKGEIERIFIIPSMFCVLDNNTVKV